MAPMVHRTHQTCLNSSRQTTYHPCMVANPSLQSCLGWISQESLTVCSQEAREVSLTSSVQEACLTNAVENPTNQLQEALEFLSESPILVVQ
jgi:hypothetical protein